MVFSLKSEVQPTNLSFRYPKYLEPPTTPRFVPDSSSRVPPPLSLSTFALGDHAAQQISTLQSHFRWNCHEVPMAVTPTSTLNTNPTIGDFGLQRRQPSSIGLLAHTKDKAESSAATREQVSPENITGGAWGHAKIHSSQRLRPKTGG